jgi:uncharacterized protein
MSPTETVKAFYAALGRGDVPTVLDLLDPNLEWTEAEGFPYYSGTWRSPQQVLDRLLVPLSQDWEEFAATPKEFLSDGDRVISFGEYSGTAKTTGKQMRAGFSHRWQVRNGKIVKFNMYADTLLVDRALH